MACPVKNKSWKNLVKYTGSSEAAHRVYLAHGNNVPQIDTITDIKKLIKFESTVFGNKPSTINYIISKYNDLHNTSHRVVYTKKTPTSESARLVLNFMPHSVSSIIPNGGSITTAKSGDTSVEMPKDYNSIFIQGANQYVVDGEVFPSYEDAARHVDESRGTPAGSHLLTMAQIPRGSADQVLEFIEKNSKSEYSRLLAKKMRKYKSETKINIVTTNQYAQEINNYTELTGHMASQSSTGLYFPGADMITIRESSSERVLLHEMAHALSSNILNSNNKASKEFKQYFENVKSRLIEKGIPLDNYGFTNEKEFLAEIFSNSNFVELLKNQEAINPSKHRSIWSELLDFLNKIFGIEKDSLYKEALEKSIGVLDNQYTIKNISITNFRPDAMEEQSKSMARLQKTVESSIEKLSHKAKILTSSKGKSDSDLSKIIGDITDNMSKELKGAYYADSILSFYTNILRSELQPYSDNIAKYMDGDRAQIDSAYLNKINSAITLYTKISEEIMTVLTDQFHNKEYIPIYKDVIDASNELTKEMNSLSLQVNNLTRENTIKILTNVLGDNMTGSVEDLLDKIGTDINKITVAAGDMMASPDPVMQSIYKMVVFQHHNTEDAAREVAKDLYELQEKMNNAGFKDMHAFHEQYEGKNTGYIISALNWGEYYIERDRMREEIVKAMENKDLTTYEDISRYFSKLSDKDQDTYSAIKKKFHNKYMDEDGVTPKPSINNKFGDLMSKPEVKAYYEGFRKVMDISRELLPKRHRSSTQIQLMMPQMRKTYLESFKMGKDAPASIWKRIREEFVANSEDTQYGSSEVIYDEADKAAKLIPIHYTSMLPNVEDLSDDITGMTAAFFEMAHNFEGMSNISADVTSIERSLQDRKFTKGKKGGVFSESNISTMLENFKDAQIFNIKDEKITAKVPGTDKEVDVTKVMGKVLEFVKANNLFVSVSTISGAVKARIDYALDVIAQNYTSKESAWFAEKEFTKNLPSIIANIGKRKKTGMVSLVLEKNGLLGGIQEQFAKMNADTKVGRSSATEGIYGSYFIAEMGVKIKMALAVYDNYRFVDGKFITKRQFKRLYGTEASEKYDKTKKWSDYKEDTLYNAYEVKNDRLVIKKEYKDVVPRELENEVRYIIESMVAKLAGQLTSHDKTNLGRSILGKFLLLHRSWLIAGTKDRFKKTYKNVITGEMEEGYYRSTSILISNFMKEKNGIKAKLAVWDTLEDYQKHNVAKFIMDAAMLAGVMVLSAIVQGMADDEPDEYWLQFLSYSINRIFLEQGAFFNPKEPLQIVNSPTAASGLFKTVGNTFGLLFDWNKIEYGAYEDMYRIEKAIIKNSLFKNIWEMRNAMSVKQRNKYLTSQIL